MFSEAKAAAYGILAVVVLSVIGYFIYSYHSTQAENKALTTQVTVQKIENKDLKTDVEVGKQTNAIDEAVTSRNLVETKKVDQTFDTITAKADAKVAQIKRDQQAARVAPASAGATVQAPPAASPPPTVEENQVSTVRVNELWESYCAAAPDASECKKEQ